MLLRKLVSGALCVGWVLCSFAEEPVISEEILVTGSRLSRPEAKPNGFVIDSAALSVQSPVSVLDALQYTPGVYVSQPGGRGGVASLTLRGAESNFAMVQVDGVQVNDPTNTRGGSFDFGSVDINEVRRVEILRGAAAAVYGSDALAGVVNIISYDPAEPETRLTASLGEDSLRQLGLRFTSDPSDYGVVHVAASTTQDDNPSSGSTFESISARLNYDNSWGRHFLSMRLSGAESKQKSFPEDSGGEDFAVLRIRDEREADTLSALLDYRFEASDSVSLFASASHYDREEQQASPGIAGGARNPFGIPANSADSSFERTKIRSFLEYRGGRADLVAGAQWQREQGSAVGDVTFVGPTFFALQRDTVGVFAELYGEPTDQLQVGVGLRADKADGDSLQTTYRVNAEWAFASDVSLFASAGRGYKLPSFFALGNSLVGNPDLSPEKARTYEIGLSSKVLPSVRFEVAGFYSRYKDLIDFDAALFTNVNRSRVTMSGWDVTLNGIGFSNRLDYRLFFSYVDIDLKPTGRLRQRPQWRWGGALGYQLAEKVRLNLNWQHNDERYDSSIPNPAVILDDYQRLDVALHWQAHSLLRLSVAVDNLFDENYFDADGFSASSRRARLRVDWSL